MDFNIRDVNIEFSGMNFASHHDYIINHFNSGVSILELGGIQMAVIRLPVMLYQFNTPLNNRLG